jgi:hypothetical protein
MALDPNIALGIRGIEIANPIAQYAQVSQIQNAQNQNALAQYQLATAQREQESVNALNEAYRSAYNPQTGEIDINTLRKTLSTGGFGSKLPGLEKTLGELETQKLTAQKLRGEVTAQPTKLEADRTKLVDDKLKQSRQFLDTINPADPNAPQQYFNWFQANHADPILGPTLKARGITEEQFVTKIQQAMNQGPQAFAELLNQSKLGTEKFMELNKPQRITENLGGTSRVSEFPGLGGPQKVLSTTERTATPGEIMTDQRARDRLAAEQATGVLTPASLDTAAEIYRQTGNMPIGGFGKGVANMRAQIMNRATELAAGKNITPADTAANMIVAKQDVGTQTKALKDFSTGKQGQQVNAFNTAIDHLGTMDKLSDALQNNDIKAFNSIGNIVARQTGQPAPANFDAAKQIVTAEVIKAVVASGGGVTERQEAERNFATANSPAQLKGVIDTYKQLLGGQLKSLNLQYENTTGRKDFDKKLTPEAKTTLDKLRGETSKVNLAPADQQALDWAKSNPTDPRATQIKQRLGM